MCHSSIYYLLLFVVLSLPLLCFVPFVYLFAQHFSTPLFDSSKNGKKQPPDSRHIRYQISDIRQQATSNRQQEHSNNQESKATNAKRGKAKEHEAIRCLTKAKLKYLPILHSTE